MAHNEQRKGYPLQPDAIMWVLVLVAAFGVIGVLGLFNPCPTP